MKLKHLLIIAAPLMLFACESGDPVEAKKKELSDAKTELFNIRAKISTLEKDLANLGVVEENPNLALVTTIDVQKKPFFHRVDFRGSVQSRNNVLISAETPAAVQEVRVVQGQQVKKGQLLIVQDSEILKKNIKELESSLNLATTMFERQEKLWQQNIGTEVQYLESKNRKESLELKLSTTKSQLSKTRIRAPFDGIVDLVDVRVGEMAQPGFPIIRLVSMSNMYLKADVSESYVGKFNVGQAVDIFFPSTDVKLKSKVRSIGQVINPQNRTFEIEVMIPDDLIVKPNMITVITLADYQNEKAYTIPTKIIQDDRIGKFVFSVVTNEGVEMVKRMDIELGVTYANQTEIKSGVNEGDLLVVKGGLGLADGGVVKVVTE